MSKSIDGGKDSISVFPALFRVVAMVGIIVIFVLMIGKLGVAKATMDTNFQKPSCEALGGVCAKDCDVLRMQLNEGYVQTTSYQCQDASNQCCRK